MRTQWAGLKTSVHACKFKGPSFALRHFLQPMQLDVGIYAGSHGDGHTCVGYSAHSGQPHAAGAS